MEASTQDHGPGFAELSGLGLEAEYGGFRTAPG